MSLEPPRNPLELAQKAAVYLAMRAAGVNNSQLARLMGVQEMIVRCILDPKTPPAPRQSAKHGPGFRLWPFGKGTTLVASGR